MKQQEKKVLKIIGAIFSAASIVLSFVFYDFKLAIILILLISGNNLERNK
jgi:hypothetical protein